MNSSGGYVGTEEALCYVTEHYCEPYYTRGKKLRDNILKSAMIIVVTYTEDACSGPSAGCSGAVYRFCGGGTTLFYGCSVVSADCTWPPGPPLFNRAMSAMRTYSAQHRGSQGDDRWTGTGQHRMQHCKLPATVLAATKEGRGSSSKVQVQKQNY